MIKKFIGWFSSLSLNTKVVLFIALITIIPFALIMMLLLSSLSKTSLEAETKALDQTTSLVEQDLINNIDAKAQIYDLTFKNMMTDLNSVKDDILSSGFSGKLLTDYYYKHPIISNVYFINSAGSIFMTPALDTFNQTKVDLSQIKEFTFLTAANEDKFTGRWLGPYNDFKGAGEIISYVLPVWKENKWAGVVGLDIVVSNLFTEIVRLDPSQSSYILIVKNTGEFISSSDNVYNDFDLTKTENVNIFDSPIIKGQGNQNIFSSTGEKQGAFTLQSDGNKTQKIVAFSTIPSFGGKILVVSPLTEIIQIQKEKASEIQQAVSGVGITGSIYLFCLGLFIIIIAFYGARTITREIIKLRNASREVTKGKLNTRVEIKSRDEIGELAQDFNEMAARLAAYTGKLEQKVAERTAELAKKLKELAESNASLEEAKTAMINLLEDSRLLEADLKTERDRIKAIITSMGEGLIVVDKRGKINMINPVAERLLEISQDAIVGKDIATAIPLYTGRDAKEEVVADNRPISKAMKTGQVIVSSLEDNFFYKTGSGKKFSVILTAAPLMGEGISGAVTMFRDASEEKQLDEAKSGFISVASHQLRTPLTSMRWFSEMLMAGDVGSISKEQKHFVERIYEGTDRMIGLVNLLLQISRVEAGRVKIEPTPLDFKAVTQGILVALRVNISQKSQNVVVKSDPEQFPLIPMDQEIIWQVIMNLISNASRYSPEKSTITVSIVKKGDNVEYSVKDEGIGIPKDQQDRIFEKFYRAENALKYVPTGSGLGLSLAKLLVESWGGKIWFVTEEGKGTTFYFTVSLKGMLARKGDVGVAV